MERNITVILRMSNCCNLACSYCYDKMNRVNYKDINCEFLDKMEEIVEYIEKFYINKDRNFNLILHGGEPLILSSETYEIFLKRITERIKNVSLSVQTNGTLLDEKKAEILNKYDVKIGISLDGCDEQQNSNRIYKNGKNSFNKVMKNIYMLNEKKIKFGIIMTISKSNLDKEKEIYNFIKDNNIYCNIRPAFPTMQAITDDNIMSNDEYIKFFTKIFDLWYEDRSKKVELKQINEVYEEFLKVLEPERYKGTCENSNNCFGNFVALDTNGNVYSCNRTYNQSDFYLGNLNESSVESIMKKLEEMSLKRQYEIKKSKCNECEMLKFCYGGCPANAYYLYNDYTKPYLYACEQKKAVYSYIKCKLEKEGQILEYQKRK